jgi:hypothetical protein
MCPHFDPHVSASVRMCPQKMRTSASCPHPIRNCSVSTQDICCREQQWHNNNNNNNNNNNSSSSSTVGCSVSKLTTMKHFALHDRRPRKRNGTQEQQETATPAAAQQAVGAATGKANDALRCSIARCHTPQRDSS